MFLFSSISFNSLTDHFLGNLKKRITDKSDPFQPTFIVVENHYVKKYLQLKIAKKIGISANVIFFYLNDFIDFFYQQLQNNLNNNFENNFLQKNYLYAIIQKIIKENIKNPVYKDIQKYLKNKPSNQFYDLVSTITDLFDKYIYFCSAQLKEWNRQKEIKSWQHDMWKRISLYPIKLMQDKLEETLLYLKQDNHFLNNILFFNHSVIPDFLINFFEKIKSKNLDISFYFLSSSLNQKDNKYTEKLNLQKENYQQSHNCVFLNDFASKEIQKKNTFLSFLQQKIFFSKTENIEEDFHKRILSIQIAHFYSKKREIEILKEKILFYIQQGTDIENILIICPSIEEYQTLIERIFNRDLVIPYTIEIQNKSQLWESFLLLINMLQGTIFVKDFISFLQDIDENDCDYFLTLEEAIKLKNWFQKNKVFNDYQKDIFGNRWKKLICNFLENDLINEKQQYTGIHINTFEKILEFYSFIKSYRKQIISPKKMENWITLFQSIFKKFFNKNFKNENDYLQCLIKLEEQKKINLKIKNDYYFSFQEIFYFLKQQKINFTKENFLKKGVSFINTFSFNGFDFDAIAVIGVDQNFFSLEKKNSFDILGITQHRGYNLREKEMHFFFAILFHAKSFFYLSFLNERKEKTLPFIIKFFLLQLNEIFPKQKDWIQEYFISGNDIDYFKENQEYYPVYNTKVIQKAISLQIKKNEIESNQQKQKEIKNKNKKIEKREFFLKEIIEYFQNSIQNFQKNQLQLANDYEDRELELYSLPEEKSNRQFLELYPSFHEQAQINSKKLMEKSIIPTEINQDLFLENYSHYFDVFQQEKNKELESFSFHQKEINLLLENYKIGAVIDFYCNSDKNQNKKLRLFHYSIEKTPFTAFINFFFQAVFLSCSNVEVEKHIFLDLDNNQKLIINEKITDAKKKLITLIQQWNKKTSSNEYFFLPPKSTNAFFIEYFKKNQKAKEEKINSSLKKSFSTWNGTDQIMGEKDYSTMKYFLNESISHEEFEKKILQDITNFLPLLDFISLEKIY